MKFLNLILAVLIILIIAFITLSNLLMRSPKAQINGHTFSLYLAKTAAQQQIGLAKYQKIDMNQGMLFLFAKSDYYSFWMKNMHFPIDIIFIRDNKVVDVFNNVPVWLNDNLPIYTTKTKADKVLEINAGLARKYGITSMAPEIRL